MTAGTEPTLFISGQLPSLDVPAAGHQLSARYLALIASTESELDILAFRGGLSDGYSIHHLTQAADVCVFQITNVARLAGTIRYPSLPSGVSVRKFLASRHVADLLNRRQYGRIILDFTQAAAVLPEAWYSACDLRVHDIVSQVHARRMTVGSLLDRSANYVEYRRWRRWERRLILSAKIVRCLSEKDRDHLLEMGRRGPIIVERPSSSMRKVSRDSIDPNMFVFFGNMARPENQDAVLVFCHDILPLIRRRFPGAYLAIVGANPPDKIINMTVGKAKWFGFIAEPEEIFEHCVSGVVPLRLGSGVKIKVLDFLAAGLPVITSSVGAEGIDSSPLMEVEDDPQSFADRCIDLIIRARTPGAEDPGSRSHP